MSAVSHLSRSKSDRFRQTIIGGDPPRREQNDFYATCPTAVSALLSVERFNKRGLIWEPACGTGNISRVLTDHGYRVRSTDLIDRGYGDGGVNFLTCKLDDVSAVVTNPPFKFATAFVVNALAATERRRGVVAMFLKTTFWESAERAPVLDDHPPARFYPFADRVACLRGGLGTDHGVGGGMMAFAWFVWDWSVPPGPCVVPRRLRARDHDDSGVLTHPMRGR